MRLLLDTHVFLWWLGDHPRLSKPARGRIAATPEVLVSAAAIWEIAIKLSTGRLRMAARDARRLSTLVTECGFSELPITGEHAAGVRALALHHGDPFDRLMIAQALIESATIMTADEAFSAYEVATIAV